MKAIVLNDASPDIALQLDWLPFDGKTLLRFQTFMCLDHWLDRFRPLEGEEAPAGLSDAVEVGALSHLMRSANLLP
jgi:hypothetical protein